MENIIAKNTFNSNESFEKETPNLDKLSKKEAYKLFTPWEKFKYRFNQFLNAIYIIRCICCFTSVFSLIGTLILLFGGSFGVAGFMFVIGLPSAILACPFKFIGISMALIAGGFSIGLCFLGFGCIIGAAIGFILSVVLFIYCPVFVTVPHYFKELR